MELKLIILCLVILFVSCSEKKLNLSEVNTASDGLVYYQGKPFTGKVFDLHKNGKLKYEMELAAGKKNGSIKTFNEEGKLIQEENYDNGRKHGKFIKYLNNGKLEYEKYYIRDTMDGRWVINKDEFNGTIITYDMGKRNGYYKNINPYGDEEGSYNNNLQAGIWKKYDFYKRLISENEYKDGVLDGIWRTFDPQTGLVIDEGLYHKGRIVINAKESYNSVRIGSQTWMAENLSSTTFQNGDTISTELYQYFRNDPQNYASKYGVFYNWEVVNDKRNICPNGWRIPTKLDWEILLNYLGDGAIQKLKSNFGWERYYGVSGTNESGMNVLPVADNSAFFWSNTEMDEGNAWGIGFGRGDYLGGKSKKYFETCRCIKQ